MKKNVVLSVLVLSALVLFWSQQAFSGPIEMKWANYFPVPSMQSKICEQFIKDIEAKTEGKVKFTYFPAGTLLSATKIVNEIV